MTEFQFMKPALTRVFVTSQLLTLGVLQDFTSINFASTRSSQQATKRTMIEKNENNIHHAPEFDKWLSNVTDVLAKAAILNRLDRAKDGHFGDCEAVGSGMSEMRVFVGPGYRVYFVRTGTTDYTMLTGSDKTDQARGIKRAKKILDSLTGK